MTTAGRVVLTLSSVLCCVLSSLMLRIDVASAAEQLVPTRTLVVRNPPSGASRRKIVWKVREVASTHTVVGNPVADGAQVHVVLTPGGDQCFSMPASGWKAVGTSGFRYKDRQLLNGPIKVAQIKKSASGSFLLRMALSGKGTTPITVVPGNTTTTYGINFELGLGDDYCSGTGTATPRRNDAKTFRLTNDTAPASCPILPCSA